MAREKATNEKSVEKRQEALTKATQGVAAQVRRKTKKTSAPGIAVAAGDVDKGYLWENDPSLVPMTPQRRKLIDGMAAETLKRLTPAPEKVEKPSTPVEKWQAAFAKSEATWKMANTLAKALAKRSSKRWQFVDFLGPKGRESAGVVDILAIRKNSAKPPPRRRASMLRG